MSREDDHKIAGYCPMGCGDTLFRGEGGYVTCSWAQCPRPDAAADLLLIRETEHIVVLERDGFSIQHPLRERLDPDLFCAVHDRVAALTAEIPIRVGRYRVRVGERLHWERLDPHPTADFYSLGNAMAFAIEWMQIDEHEMNADRYRQMRAIALPAAKAWNEALRG